MQDADCVFDVVRDTTAEEVNRLLKEASETAPLKVEQESRA